MARLKARAKVRQKFLGAAILGLALLQLPSWSRAGVSDDDGVITHRREYKQPLIYDARHRAGTNEAVIGIVERMAGQCYVVRGGHGGKNTISIGLRVFERDDLVTDDTSRLHVRYKDGTYVELGAGSSFESERIRFVSPNLLPSYKPSDNFDQSVFRFNSGLARITAPDIHPLEWFTVKTPSAVIKVTGPSDFYLVQLENDRELTVRVIKGKVEVMNTITNEAMLVPEGTGAYQKTSGMVTNAGRFTDEQLAFLKSRTRI